MRTTAYGHIHFFGMTGAVIVLYNPDFGLLEQVIEALKEQVDMICIVDNSAQDNRTMIRKATDIEYIALNGNRGIAAAQNIGIRRLIALQCRYILLADQDSIASPHMVEELKRRHRILSRIYDIAAIGPMPINRKTGLPYTSSHDERILRRLNHEGYEFIEAHSIISSFSLLSVEALHRTGEMNERLFIDFVDQEWCWRARRCGLRVFIVPDLRFSHEQGRYRRHWGMGLNISTPARLYYQIRNLLWLARQEISPRSWRRKNLRKMCLKIIGYPLLVTPRAAYLKSIVRGLRDGLKHKQNYEREL